MPERELGRDRSGLLGAMLCPDCRSKRVVVLLIGVVLMSLGDLHMTLEHLTHIGMAEANPFAHAMIQYGSRTVLIAWKLATIILAVGILLYARRRWSAEVAAIFCCAVMTWLSARWLSYSEHLTQISRDGHELVQAEDHRWISLPAEP